MKTETVHMVEQSRSALQGVRSALIELYSSLGADPTSPQEVARRFGINRNLTWKVSRVINAPDPFSSLNHLPGGQGLDLVVEAFEKNGAPAEAVRNVKSALEHFSGVIDVHAGDREHLELTLESMGLFEREGAFEGGRELAYRGNSMVWGLQAKTRMTLGIIAPAARGEGVDCVHVSGLVNFRRLRPSVRWRLFRSQAQDDKGGDIPGPEELEDKAKGDDPMILREFCSPNMPKLECKVSEKGREFVLPGGPVGNLAAFDCFYGYAMRNLASRRTPDNEFGSIGVVLTLPVETLVCDLVFHRDVRPKETPEVLVYGIPNGEADDASVQTPQNLLPMMQTPVELAGSPPAVATPLVPRYSALMQRIYARMNWKGEEFVGMRVQMRYPPISSRVVVRWRLE